MKGTGVYVWGALFVGLLVYVGGLFGFIRLSQKHIVPKIANTQIVSVSDSTLPNSAVVLGTNSSALPTEYSIVMVPRKQQFNLSCEFGAGSAIIYHYTGDSRFSVQNAKNAEKILIKQVGVSKNPNLGIRMGLDTPISDEELFANLDKKFGGEDYYGVHAPPFIDLFELYGLSAKPIPKDKNTFISAIQKALYSGHVVMTWLKIGYGKPVDVAFSYGNVPVIRGEHTVVIVGYSEKSVSVMDPAGGTMRTISWDDLARATDSFIMPYLEIIPAQGSLSVDQSVELGTSTGLPREKLNIEIYNATKKAGAGNSVAVLLKEFGYNVSKIANSKSEIEGISLVIKPELTDYVYLLKKDLNLAQYSIASTSADLNASSSADAIITVGE